MLANLQRYIEPIVQACLIFPVVAALFTLPFMVVNYRKYGGIALMRVLVVYSFILYCMCAFLLTVLPLPSRAEVAAMKAPGIGWVPFTDLAVGLNQCGIRLSDPSTWGDFANWRRFFRSDDFFQIGANIVMQIPLGFYLRYYFRCSLRKTALIGFLTSLFYELTQLSGLFFIYPHAYRFASADDLINNTLGAVIGYLIAPALTLILPSRDEIDRISYRKGEQLTLIRRSLAALIDIAALTLIVLLTGVQLWWVPVLFFAYFVGIPGLTAGRTPGQALLRLRVVREKDGKAPVLWQLATRNVLLYLVEPFLALLAMGALFGLVFALMTNEWESILMPLLTAGCVAVLLTVAWIFLSSQKKWNAFPHGHFSRTVVLQTPRKRSGKHAPLSR